jgi:CubicO group peptidase (beta-lactamase class C family)
MIRTTGIRLMHAGLLVFILALSACASPLARIDKPESSTGDLAALRAHGDGLLGVALKNYPRLGLSAAIVDSRSVLWSGSGGVIQGTEHTLELGPDTPMHLASITKIFTALAIMQLVEQGKIDLDANLRTYIPEFSIHSRFGGSDFTIRQMLTHYSGLPSALLADYSADPAQVRSLFDSTVQRSAETHLKSPPALAHSYSNLAFQLLGIVIQRVSGESYDGYMNAHIFAPLGMRHSAVLVPDGAGRWPLEQVTTDPREYGYVTDSSLSAGSIVSSLNDMARFAQMLLAEGEGIVSKESFREMQRVQNADMTLGGPGQGLPFQMELPPTVPQPSFGHGGSKLEHNADLRIFPQQGVGVIVMEATNGFLGPRLSNDLRDVALEYVEPGSTGRPPLPGSSPIEPVIQSAEEAERYAGLYFIPVIGLLRVDHNAGELTLHALTTSMGDTKLVALGNDTFSPGQRLPGLMLASANLVGSDGVKLQFMFLGGRRYITLAANGQPPQAVAASLEVSEVNTQWQKRFGTYHPADEAGERVTDITIEMQENLKIPVFNVTSDGQKSSFALELLSDSQAATAGVGRNAGEVIEFVSEDEFAFKGARFKRI